MSEEPDLNKLAADARKRNLEKNATLKPTREELFSKADELDARKQSFAKLNELAQ
jgi:hypothetical protein